MSEAQNEPAVTPPVADPATTPVTPPQAPPHLRQQAPGAVPPPPAQPPRVRLTDDGEIPSDATLLELSPSALSKRLERHTASQLTKRFGTADLDTISARLERLDVLEQAEKEREMESLSVQERLERERDEAAERAERAEQEAAHAKDQVIIQQVDGKVMNLINQHVKEKAGPSVVMALKHDINANWSDEEKNDMRLGMKKAEEFIKDYLSDLPELSKDFKSTARVEPLTTGAGQQRPGSTNHRGESPTNSSGPKKATEMTDAEWRAEKRRRGYTH